MGLTVRRITVQNFRSYRALELSSLGPLTIFVGPNAVGKTNIVEGMQLVTALTSFRNATVEQLIRQGASAARVEAEISDGNRQLTLDLHLAEGSRKYTLNGKAKRTADLKGLVPSVSFTPDDLELVKGPMGVRRAALDALGSQLSANHYVIRKDYEKVLRYKNRLLKEEAPTALIESINETLVTCGAQLACYRSALFAKLAVALSRHYGTLASRMERLDAAYVPSWDVQGSRGPQAFLREGARLAAPAGEARALGKDEARAALVSALNERMDDERQRHRALVGPHADRIEFMIEGKDAAVFGSQGQQRSVVLAFKLAEASIIEEIAHQKPILLLDDVMSELDAARRSALVSFISGGSQTFITTTNLAYFDADMLAQARIIDLPLGSDDGQAARAQEGQAGGEAL